MGRLEPIAIHRRQPLTRVRLAQEAVARRMRQAAVQRPLRAGMSRCGKSGSRSLTAVEWPSMGSPTRPPLGRIQCPPNIDFDEVGLREAQQPPLEAAGTRIGVSKGVCCLST